VNKYLNVSKDLESDEARHFPELRVGLKAPEVRILLMSRQEGDENICTSGESIASP
jgi:hypothetical protein